jgi:hypothetical protein
MVRRLRGIADGRRRTRTGGVGQVDPRGTASSYIEDLKRRKGADADQPHRVQYERLVRA